MGNGIRATSWAADSVADIRFIVSGTDPNEITIGAENDESLEGASEITNNTPFVAHITITKAHQPLQIIEVDIEPHTTDRWQPPA